MSHEILMREFKLGSEDRAFVLVGVLKTEGPTAIKAGNKAIILSDGSIEGWIGGHCTENEIVSNAMECLKDGTTRFLNLTTCQGGRMDVYLEPYLPKRRLIVFGRVPIVAALSRLASALNFKVTVVDKQASLEKYPGAEKVLGAFEPETNPKENMRQTFAVIATMGEFDADLALKLCALNSPYIGIVAGKKRASELFSYLKSKKVPEEQIARVRAPAGIYIRAVTAEEIALSIMAEIVEVARSDNADLREYTHRIEKSTAVTPSNPNPSLDAGKTSAEEILIDPVCGMTVESSSEFQSTLDGHTVFFFCCEACKESFDKEPQKYILANSS